MAPEHRPARYRHARCGPGRHSPLGPHRDQYSHSAGYESYRKGLASYYAKHGIHITHEQIIVTNGGSEALLFGMMACFEPGDEVMIPEPYYANYNSFALSAGVKVVPVRSTIQDGFARPRPSAPSRP